VWSLGCVLYHCMTLHAPFDGTNPLSVASKIVEGAYDAVRVIKRPRLHKLVQHLDRMRRVWKAASIKLFQQV
jgi:serine/threonine protein kinase